MALSITVGGIFCFVYHEVAVDDIEDACTCRSEFQHVEIHWIEVVHFFRFRFSFRVALNARLFFCSVTIVQVLAWLGVGVCSFERVGHDGSVASDGQASESLDELELLSFCHHNRLLDWIVRAGGVESVACFIDGVAVTAAGGFPAVVVALCVGVITERRSVS
jgi:hypothetical protein